MGKFFGIVGFVTSQEDPDHPGVFIEVPTEREYGGDTIRHIRRWQGVADQVNDDVTIDEQISIFCDPFAFENLSHIRYVERYGSFWKVTAVEPQYPRLVLSIGGVYNGVHGSQTGTSPDSGGTSGE